MRRVWNGVAVVLLIVLTSTGCRLIPGTSGSSSAERKADILGDRLQEFHYRYQKKMGQAMANIETTSEDPRVQSKAVYFRLLSSPYARDAVYRSDPLTALLDLWSLCVQTRVYFETGEEQNGFGDLTALALQAAQDLEKEIEAVAEDTLDGVTLDRARKTVHQFAEEYPAKSPFSRDSIRTYFESKGDLISLSWFFDTSLSPLRAIGGLDETALAIYEIAHAAEEMTSVVNALPDRIRLQTKVLLYEVSANPNAKTTFASIDRVSRSAEDLVRIANELPTRLRTEVESAGPELNSAMVELRETIAVLEKTLDAATRTTDGIARAGTALEGTLTEFRGMMSDFDKDEGPPPETPPEPGKPFDIEEYTRSAEAIAQAGASLQAVLAELRGMTASEETQTAIDRTAGVVEGVALKIVFYAAGLFVFCSGVAFALRTLSRRSAPRPSAD